MHVRRIRATGSHREPSVCYRPNGGGIAARSMAGCSSRCTYGAHMYWQTAVSTASAHTRACSANFHRLPPPSQREHTRRFQRVCRARNMRDVPKPSLALGRDAVRHASQRRAYESLSVGWLVSGQAYGTCVCGTCYFWQETQFRSDVCPVTMALHLRAGLPEV